MCRQVIAEFCNPKTFKIYLAKNKDEFKETLKKHPDVRFILTAGDNTNCGQTDIQWTGLLEGLKDFFKLYNTKKSES